MALTKIQNEKLSKMFSNFKDNKVTIPNVRSLNRKAMDTFVSLQIFDNIGASIDLNFPDHKIVVTFYNDMPDC